MTAAAGPRAAHPTPPRPGWLSRSQIRCKQQAAGDGTGAVQHQQHQRHQWQHQRQAIHRPPPRRCLCCAAKLLRLCHRGRAGIAVGWSGGRALAATGETQLQGVGPAHCHVPSSRVPQRPGQPRPSMQACTQAHHTDSHTRTCRHIPGLPGVWRAAGPRTLCCKWPAPIASPPAGWRIAAPSCAASLPGPRRPSGAGG
jgi:hypothetical protein